MEQTKKLTLFEAASIIAGLGVGGGVMAVPYLASLNGMIPFVAIMLLAYLVSLLLHLMITEIVMRDGGEYQLVELLGKYLFPQRPALRRVFLWIFFGLIVFSFYALLAGYIAGAGEILVSLTGLPFWAGNIIFYGVAAGVVFFGLKVMGLSEKYAIAAAALILAVLSCATIAKPAAPVSLFTGGGKEMLALFGMIMFCFASFFSIPQAREGLYWRKSLLPWAVVLGLGINFCFTFVVTLMAQLASPEVTEMAIIGWGGAIGQWASLTGSIFVFLAILTSYWATSYALTTIIVERMGWGYRPSWLLATAPTLILAVSGLTGFLGFMRLAGGAIAVLVALLIIPALRTSRHTAPQGLFSTGRWGDLAGQLFIAAAYILAAIGSLIAIK
ncbi:MAG: hypothetical protein GX883_07395 [Firmicutes bacterium]|nr:hypothetical protein [Bacillota bacterium]